VKDVADELEPVVPVTQPVAATAPAVDDGTQVVGSAPP
jgi:hypothetical protein